jgi:hypothetical protein
MNLTCSHCNWVHFEVSLDHAKHATERFYEYYYTKLNREQQRHYTFTDLLREDYARCFRCGSSWLDMRKSTKEEVDRTAGSTVQPVLGPTVPIEDVLLTHVYLEWLHDTYKARK